MCNASLRNQQEIQESNEQLRTSRAYDIELHIIHMSQSIFSSHFFEMGHLAHQEPFKEVAPRDSPHHLSTLVLELASNLDKESNKVKISNSPSAPNTDTNDK